MVITGFGRLGAPFASQYFGVVPDLITAAKGLTNGAVPMGAVFAKREVHDAFMHGADNAIELFHGYTYSGHPLACAAANASLDVYERDKLFARAAELSEYWATALHGLNDAPYVIDIRTIGLVGAVELQSLAGQPGKRAFSAFLDAYESGILVRTTGDTIALSPPLIITQAQIDELTGVLREVLGRLD